VEVESRRFLKRLRQTVVVVVRLCDFTTSLECGGPAPVQSPKLNNACFWHFSPEKGI
jgi:hypothetical protein